MTISIAIPLEEQTSAPSLLLAGLEPIRAVAECASLLQRVPARFPRGQGQPILVVPGLGANHHLTWALRKRLQHLNYDAYDWEMGVNLGPGEKSYSQWLDPLAAKLAELQSSYSMPVTLVGWSLGGLVARELSRLQPDKVKAIVTMGTPYRDFNSATNAMWIYELVNGNDSMFTEQELAALEAEPSVPSVSLYSKADGVVSWRASFQREASNTRHVEVPNASHLGMTVNMDVLGVLATELARIWA